MLGRAFVADDEKPGMRAAVLSHETWQSIFGSDPAIVGHNITLDGNSYTVAGVMPAGFQFPLDNPTPALWTSLADDATGKDPMTGQRGAHMATLIGRLKNGVSIEQARADLDLIAQNLSRQYPDSNTVFDGALVVPELQEDVPVTSRTAFHVLFAAVVFLLLIACANVAGLMLARTTKRKPEIAVRAALGASRLGLVRQALVESVVMSLCGGALGVVFSVILLRTLLRFVPENLPRLGQVAVDGPVLLFAAITSILTGVVFGVLPALRMSRLDPALALREGTRSVTSGRGQHRLHGGLVIAETAIGLVLLIGAGLLIRSFVRVLNVDPGFDPHQVLTAEIDLPDKQYPGVKGPQFFDELLARVAALPGVQSVAAGYPLPLSHGDFTIGFQVEGRPVPEGREPAESVSVVTPGFFHTLRIPLLAGRDFLPTDDSKAPAVVIVNQAFVKKYFPGEDAVGKRFQPGLGDGVTDQPMRQIVGVVADVKRNGITANTKPQYYMPYKQAIVVAPPLVIRTAGDPKMLIAPVRAQVAALDSNIPVFHIKTMEDYVSSSAAQPRFQTMLITSFAVLALLLSAIGLYAVLSYMVAQRTLEIGLRLALGAQRDSVLGLVLQRGMFMALAGVAIGIVASLGLTRFMEKLLYGVKPFDLLTFAGVSAVLLLVSLIASSVPAYRAARLDPMQTLRER